MMTDAEWQDAIAADQALGVQLVKFMEGVITVANEHLPAAMDVWIDPAVRDHCV